MKPVDVLGVHIEVANGSPVLLLREQDAPQRIVPLYVGEVEAVAIAAGLAGASVPRPMTHDLLAMLLESIGADVAHIEVTEIRHGAFIAEIRVKGPKGEHGHDSRPSDAIALALRVDAPIYVSDAVLDESGMVLQPSDDDAIDEQVRRLRQFLADVDPSQFGTDMDGPPEPPAP